MMGSWRTIRTLYVPSAKEMQEVCDLPPIPRDRVLRTLSLTRKERKEKKRKYPVHAVDLYHWSSERFSAAWKTTISVLVAKGRARVGVAAAAADWPKRIRDLQFLDHEGYATAT